MLLNKPFQMFSIILAIMVISIGARAQTPQQLDLETPEIHEKPAPPEVALPVPPISVSSVSSEEIRKDISTELASSVVHHPGIYFQHPQPQAASLSVRGQNGSRNIIRIEGIRYANGLYGTFPNQYFSTISPAFVEDLHVRKGPQSFFFANGGTGNVIDVTLLSPETRDKGAHGESRFYYSSGTHTPGVVAHATTVRDTHAVSLGADYFSLGDIRTGNGDKLPFTTAEQADWFAKVILQPKDSPVVVTGGYMGHITEDKARTDQLGLGTLHLYDNQDNLVYINLAWKPTKVFKKVNILASYHQMMERTRRYNCRIDGGRNRIQYPACRSLGRFIANNAQKTQDTVDTFGIDASSRLSLYEDRVFLFGNLEYYFDNIISSMEAADIDRADPAPPVFLPQNRGLYSSGSYASKFGTSLGVNANLLRTDYGELWIQYGGRFSHFASYAPIVPDIEEDIHYTNGGFTHAASIMWSLDERLMFWGSYTTGMRPPSLQETTSMGYINDEYYIPRVELEEELSNSFEAGAHLSLKPVRLGAVWFYNKIENYIDDMPVVWEGAVRREDGTSVVGRYNADDAVFKGIENSLELFLGDFTLFGTLTWQRGTIHDDTEGYMATITNDARNYPTRKTPALFGTAGLKYIHPNQRFHVGIRMDWADEQTRLHPLDKRALSVCESGVHTGNLKSNCSQFAGYYTFGINGGVQITPNADVSLSLQNILDRDYQTLGSAQREPGFDARTMIRLHF